MAWIGSVIVIFSVIGLIRHFDNRLADIQSKIDKIYDRLGLNESNDDYL